MLAQIVGYLKFSSSVHYENPPQSAQALANAARVSRLFYELAMPLLWEEVDLWEAANVRPYTLLKYPGTVERVSPYIRTMHLSVGKEDENLDKTKLNKIKKFSSRCLQILTAATCIKSLHLYIYMYNIDNHPPELRSRLEAINNVIFRILRHVETMELDEFAWRPGSETVRSSDALRIIERKITAMRLSHLECGEWVDHLPNHERLRSHRSSSLPTQMNPASLTANFGRRLLNLTTAGKSLIVIFQFPSVGVFNSEILLILICCYSFLSGPTNGLIQLLLFLNICPCSRLCVCLLRADLIISK